jgi:hypothetical protein
MAHLITFDAGTIGSSRWASLRLESSKLAYEIRVIQGSDVVRRFLNGRPVKSFDITPSSNVLEFKFEHLHSLLSEYVDCSAESRNKLFWELKQLLK